MSYGAEEVLKKLGSQTSIDKHLEAVVKQVSIWEHFDNREKFPQGLDTFIHGYSDRLTGGEKRSVANARALLRVTPILLLDEPTAGLDASNEQKVIESMIRNRPEGQTVVVIAHRLSTLREADEIVFVESDGTVNESGRVGMSLLRRKERSPTS
jgi:ATP-binding cassette subfamily B protein